MGELSWMLFLAKALRITLKEKDVEAVTQIASSVCALLLCDLFMGGFIEGRLNRRVWNSYLNEEGLRSEMWLYAYEGTLKRWTGSQTRAFVQAEKYFSELLSRKIEFYDATKNIERLTSKLRREREATIKQLMASSTPIEEIDFEMIGDVYATDLSDFDDETYG
jgi:hypothetical protein